MHGCFSHTLSPFLISISIYFSHTFLSILFLALVFVAVIFDAPFTFVFSFFFAPVTFENIRQVRCKICVYFIACSISYILVNLIKILSKVFLNITYLGNRSLRENIIAYNNHWNDEIS